MSLKRNVILATVAAVSLGTATLLASNVSADEIADTNFSSYEKVFYVDLDKSGEITLDENGNVVSNSNPDAIVEDNGLSFRFAENNAWGRWVVYTDGFGPWKTGHSNFYSTLGSHFSWVSMGSQAKTYDSAPAGKYSTASQRGNATFHAGYGLY